MGDEGALYGNAPEKHFSLMSSLGLTFNPQIFASLWNSKFKSIPLGDGCDARRRRSMWGRRLRSG